VSFLRNREDLSIRDRKAGVLDASRYGRPVAQLIRSAGRLLSDDSRLDESSSEDPSASCSPAELASVSPTICDSAKPKSCCPALFRLSGQLCLNSCLSEGDKSIVSINYDMLIYNSEKPICSHRRYDIGR
jgi:hypothetical protein